MPVALRIRLTRGAEDPVTFDLEGEVRWAMEVRHEESQADEDTPPRPVEVRGTWDITGAATISQDGTIAGGWSRFVALLATLTASGDEAIDGLEVLRVDSDGTESVEYSVAAPTWYDLRLERVESDGPLPETASGHQRTTHPITLRLSAARATEGSNGDLDDVVSLTQRVKLESLDSLRSLTWETEAKTRPGTDARTKVVAYGLIPISTLGRRWAYATNDDSGIDLESEGGRELPTPARVPTVARGISRVQEFGVDVGATGPGTSPSYVSVVTEETETPDGYLQTVTATARGPGAERWAMAWKPAGVKESSTTRDPAARGFSVVWTTRRPAQRPTLDVEVDLEGGGQAVAFRPRTRGLPPLEFEGPLLAWTAVVSITVSRYGGTGTRAELAFPAVLPEPWRLILPESREGSPREVERSVDPASVKWERTCRLVYRAATLTPASSGGTTPRAQGGGGAAAGFPDPAVYLRANAGVVESYGA